MELSTQDIERIVSEVVRRLRQAGVDVQSKDDGPSVSTAEAAGGTTCTLSEHVISMDSIQGRLENVQQLVVGARAVVTPAVVDTLRERKITLQRAAS